MATRKVIVMGHPTLREQTKAVPVEAITSSEVQALIGDMVETMAEYDGRGLAAPQINVSLQILVMLWDFDKEQETSLRVLINPQIEALTQEKEGYWEGCLSLPGMRGYVERPNKINVKAYNPKGEAVEFVAESFAATVIQHEYDHLIGKLYIDRMTDLTKLSFEREYLKYHHAPQA